MAERFRARVFIAGINPYVDVPARVSRAFAPHARGGRVRVECTLKGVSMQATLVPVKGGRHRLYLHGGMRAAAGVVVGDTVSFSLRASGDEVPVPADLARGLGSARAAFDALGAARRRELVRFIEAARTPALRERRIVETVDHLAGRAAEPARKAAVALDRPLWTCPKCGNSFVTRNMNHSCARHTLDDPFTGKPPAIRALFDRLRARVDACGPGVKLVAYRDRIAFMVKVRFAGAPDAQRARPAPLAHPPLRAPALPQDRDPVPQRPRLHAASHRSFTA